MDNIFDQLLAACRPVILPDYAELDLKIPDDARCPAWVCFDGKQVRPFLILIGPFQHHMALPDWSCPILMVNLCSLPLVMHPKHLITGSSMLAHKLSGSTSHRLL